MKIEEMVAELNLVYFGYNEEKKELVCRMECNQAIAEFTKINEALEKYNIPFTIININYIKIDT